jgi:hypothetical protein
MALHNMHEVVVKRVYRSFLIKRPVTGSNCACFGLISMCRMKHVRIDVEKNKIFTSE